MSRAGLGGPAGTQFWLISVPLEGRSQQAAWAALKDKTEQEAELATSYRFNVPELRVGTLDSLLALSDDLAKVTAAAKRTGGRNARQLHGHRAVDRRTGGKIALHPVLASLPSPGARRAARRHLAAFTTRVFCPPQTLRFRCRTVTRRCLHVCCVNRRRR